VRVFEEDKERDKEKLNYCFFAFWLRFRLFLIPLLRSARSNRFRSHFWLFEKRIAANTEGLAKGNEGGEIVVVTPKVSKAVTRGRR
jgi:hypothetical protein